MRSELRQQLPVLDSDIEASNVDDFMKADLRARVGVLMKQISDAHA